jgi:hypothetical protein
LPKPKKNFTDKWYKEYLSLKDSIAKDSMVKELATIKEYKETFEDTVQTIDVYAKTRGDLLELRSSYKLKPFLIKDKVKVEMEVPKDIFSIDFGMKVGIPDNGLDNTPIVMPELGIRINKFRGTVGYDTNSTLWLGGNIILF